MFIAGPPWKQVKALEIALIAAYKKRRACRIRLSGWMSCAAEIGGGAVEAFSDRPIRFRVQHI